MKANVVRIGNSRGIRLPKAILRQCRIETTVELQVQDDHLIVRPVHAPRQGWDEAFAQMTQHGEDRLLDGEIPPTDWDKAEWRW